MSADPTPAPSAALLIFDDLLARLRAVRDRIVAGDLPAPPDVLAVAAFAEDLAAAGPMGVMSNLAPTPGDLDSGTPPTPAELIREAVDDLRMAYHNPDVRVHLLCKAHRLAYRALLRLEREGGTP